MKHSVTNRKELTILKIEEQVFDFRHGKAYQTTIEELIDGGSTNLIVDFNQVKAIDSCGISSILLTHQLANKAHGLAIFVALCQQIKDLLKLTSLDKQLYIFSSINEVMTLVEPAMKTRRGAKGKQKASDFDGTDEDTGEDLDELDDEAIGAEAIEDDEFMDRCMDDDDEDEGGKPAEKPPAKKRGRPKGSGGNTIRANGSKSTRA
ncbi:STAS domain-containing protein [Chlorobium sp. N1]|uniref:STAS domain-containing protein n=1 Tax=Chlorobium sp. N1 TaxID=2491138 RepID=UPI00103C0DEC|nr:STAS domain-containing protein [Chlorobium sp. N1]TCD47180.1 anti-sigma factor antagonist [Chlorobium sp. N1]